MLKFLRSFFFSLMIFGIHSFCLGDELHPSILIPQTSLLPANLATQGENEVAVVQRLIETTQEQVVIQQHLKELMIQFNQQQEAFFHGDQTKKSASTMVRTARQILEIISNQHIQHLFPQSYLDELHLFSSIASKNQIKRP